jgi:DNA-binding response OmpR family regulator
MKPVIISNAEPLSLVNDQTVLEKASSYAARFVFCLTTRELENLLCSEFLEPIILVLDCDIGLGSYEYVFQLCLQARMRNRSVFLIGCISSDAVTSGFGSEATVETLKNQFDDIVVTPIRQNEFLFRLENILDKVSRLDRRKSDSLKFGPLHFDLRMMTASANSQNLRLTRKETEILLYMAYRAERVIDRKDLVNDLWDGTAYSESIESVLNGHLSRIRDKLGRSGCRGILKTVRGLGVCLTLQGYEQHWSLGQNANEIRSRICLAE